jgi:hypothetical protein
MIINIDIATCGDGHNMAGAGIVTLKQGQAQRRLDLRAFFGPVSPYVAETAILMLAFGAVSPKQRQLGTTVHTTSVAAHDIINTKKFPLNFDKFAHVVNQFKAVTLKADSGVHGAEARRLARQSLTDKLYECSGQY